ncbi:cytochrome c [Thalassococcus sp. CAU 1522]|uniref:Cytochrome c n=1 Tax=Thalassococcus arenae TaxID=2851652 RepID=A0ABS6NAV3_9RHOB|nr:cytochrome c [Thalassococcus arenae]MBV2361129.1 cytochrome c [Thalassococcus arenae]
MRRLATILAAAIFAAALIGWLVTGPDRLSAAETPIDAGDATRGALVFAAAGCGSCHHAPEAEDKTVLAGGQRFPSDFGTFVAPNISPDPDHGIGGWDLTDFANAVMRGVSPDGQHYFPAFPYTAYEKMTPGDLADLWAFLRSLPPSSEPSQPHEVGFPFNIRRAVGGWKLLYRDPDWVLETAPGPEAERGRYLVEALGHCGECHTPRDMLGGLDRARWLRGAPNPSGTGTIPPLTPDKFTWSATDIAYYLETGFTPDFDSAGGHMVAVIDNFAKLPASDRQAVAAYLKALPAP